MSTFQRKKLDALLLTPLLLSFLACSKLPEEELPTDNEAPEQIDADYPCDDCKFRSAGFSHSHLDGKQLLFKLEAREVIKRARQGSFLRFSDYEELYFDSLNLMQFVSASHRLVSLDLDEFYHLADLKSNQFQHAKPASLPDNNQTELEDNPLTNVSTKPESIEFQPKKQAKPTGLPDDNQTEIKDKLLTHQLNRILAKPVTIEFQPERQAKITLKADNAQMLTDSMIIAFDSHVEVNAKHCRLSADSALWSNQHQGLLFLDGVNINGKTQPHPRFISLQADGFCKASRQIPLISNEDKLAAIENQMLVALPIEYQILLGLAGAPASLEANQ